MAGAVGDNVFAEASRWAEALRAIDDAVAVADVVADVVDVAVADVEAVAVAIFAAAAAAVDVEASSWTEDEWYPENPTSADPEDADQN